jgi:hypothetical protein
VALDAEDDLKPKSKKRKLAKRKGGKRRKTQDPQPDKSQDLRREEGSGWDTDVVVVSDREVSDREVSGNSDCELPWPLKREDAIASTYFLK